MKRIIFLGLVIVFLLLSGYAGYLYLDQRAHDIQGTISDEETGQPIAGARVQAGGQTVASDVSGRFSLSGLRRGAAVSANAPGYLPQGEAAVHGALLDSAWPVSLTLRPNLLEGDVTTAGGSPVVSATVTVNGQTALSDAQGRFAFRRIPSGAQVAVAADGFLSTVAVFQEGQPLRLSLEANTLSGVVVDQASGAPLVGVLVTVAGRDTTSDAAGQYLFRQIPRGALVTIQTDGYLSATYTFAVGEDKRVALSPNTLTGQVTDAESKSPLPGVTIQEGERTVQTNAQGYYTLTQVLRAAVLQINADGYLPARAPVEGTPLASPLPGGTEGGILDIALQPNQVQGTVRDTLTGRPVISATVYLDGRNTHTDAEGRYLFLRVKRGQSIVVIAEGYAPAGVVVGTPLASPLPGGTEGGGGGLRPPLRQ